MASAARLDLPVPTRPERTLFDLVQLVGLGRRKNASIVAAGPADAPPDESTWDDDAGVPREREALLAWWTESVELLMGVLQEAGPDRTCWTCWDDLPSPQTSGASARRQVCEIAVFAYDAQFAVGAAQPLPKEVALDGFDDCQFTLCATTVDGPHDPAVVDYHATEGRSWRLRLSPDGARAARLTHTAAEAGLPPDASATALARDLVLFFYDRIPLASLDATGDPRIFAHLAAWDPSA